MTQESKTVGIAGAGAIAFGAACLLETNGHKPVLWSPSGERTKALAEGQPLVASGALEGEFRPAVAQSAQDLAARSDVIMVALPAYGHRAVFDALAPHLREGQTVIISSHASFGALYLAKLLAQRGVTLPIIAWGTTVTTGRQPSPTQASVNTVRKKVDMSAVPLSAVEEGHALCTQLFGDRFVIRDGLLAIALSNLNPQNHLGIALGNMTRMEHGETWNQGLNTTPNVGRLLEALDRERIAIADSLGLSVRNIHQHFSLSFHVPEGPVSDQNMQMYKDGRIGNGPTTADSRYVTEDAPYGLWATVKLGELTGKEARLHRAGVDILSAMYGRDFAGENDLLNALDFNDLSLEDLQMLCKRGYERATAAV